MDCIMAKKTNDKQLPDSNDILQAAGIQKPEYIIQAFELLIPLGVKTLGADEGSLLVYRKKNNDLQFVCTLGGKAPKPLTGKTVPIGKGITGMAAMQREILTGTRASGNIFFPVPDSGEPPCVIAAPILLDDELIGSVTAVSFDPKKSFSINDCQNFAIIAELGAIIFRWSQQLAAFQTGDRSSLTDQEKLEWDAKEQAVKCLKAHPNKGNSILQILTVLSKL